jgi:predicted dehydrogenase
MTTTSNGVKTGGVKTNSGDTPGMDRRGFLRRTGAAVVAPMIVPASVLGRGAPAPSGRLQMAIIGTGGRGGGHSRVFSSFPDCRVAAVCDVNRKNGEKAKAQVDETYGTKDCQLSADFRDIMARDDIDAVSIAVPDHWHARIALEAIRAGKHVYLEKPLAYTVAEGRALVEAVRRHGVVLQQGTQQRSMSTFQRATHLAQAGFLGKVRRATAISPYGAEGGNPNPGPVPEGLDYEFWLGPAPKVPYTPGRCKGHGGVGWYHIRDYSGGWITAWGSHHVDSAQWALGKDREAPVEVNATGEFPQSGVFDTCRKWRIDYRYADGTELTFATPNEAEGKMNVLIEGDEGWVCANRGSIDAFPKSLLSVRPEPSGRPWPTNHFHDFVDAIREGREPCAPIEVAHLSTTLCHLGTIGVTLQRPLRWDGAHEHFIDDPIAERLLSRPMREPWSLRA